MQFNNSLIKLRIVFILIQGLKPGDRWALCASRWYEAFTAGFAPMVKLEATHFKALEFVPLETLEQFDDRNLNPANNRTEL